MISIFSCQLRFIYHAGVVQESGFLEKSSGLLQVTGNCQQKSFKAKEAEKKKAPNTQW